MYPFAIKALPQELQSEILHSCSSIDTSTIQTCLRAKPSRAGEDKKYEFNITLEEVHLRSMARDQC